MRATLEQVFLKRRGPVTEALVVLERERVTLTLPSDDLRGAVDLLARHLTRRPDLAGADRARLRVERAGELSDDHALRDRLRDAVARSLRDEAA